MAILQSNDDLLGDVSRDLLLLEQILNTLAHYLGIFPLLLHTLLGGQLFFGIVSGTKTQLEQVEGTFALHAYRSDGS